jgi:putative peptide zinc metalloprotease protein
MLAIRPTFSESWYRVANLRVRLRASAQISRQHYRGERWYVVRDPAGNQYHRLSDSAYRFVGLLDGSRTVEEAWDLCGGQLADDAPTQPEVIQILSHLYAANLVDADVTPDATVLLRRHKQQQKKKMQRRLMNVFFPRIPIWDPDVFLKRWMPLMEKVFSKLGAAVWLLVVGLALIVIIPRAGQFREDAARAIDLHNNTINVIYLYLTFVFIKAIHELGHAFACRRFGGECHELGIMLLIFVPTPYVDASSAWAFPSKWQRIFVGAAGMIVELFFAAICAFIWWQVPDPYSTVHQLAYNAMLIASVTTIIFNANPLLRYDGYYILSDFLEIPNLRQKSTEYSLGLIKRHVFRIKMQQPLPPAMQRFWLLTYAVASSIYRVFVSVMIMLVVAFQIPVLGVLMAVGMVVTFVVVPVVQVFRYLTVEPELHRKRGRAIAFTAVVTAAVFTAIGIIPMPYRIYSNGVVRPAEMTSVRSTEAGFVDRIMVADGQWVTKDTPLFVLKNEELDKAVIQQEADYKAQLIVTQEAMAKDPARHGIEQGRLKTIADELARLKERQEALTVKAPFDGVFVNSQINQMLGTFIGPAADYKVGTLLTMHEIEIRSVLEQRDATRVTPANVRDVKVRLVGDVGTELTGSTPEVLGAAQPELVSQALGSAGGGEVAIDPSDRKGTKPMQDQFEVRTRLTNPDSRYVPGQRAIVRLTLKNKAPLVAQWSIRFWQLIQTRSQQAKM